MGRSINQVTLLGNVGNDPEVRRFGERSVARFSLATTERWKDKKSGEWKEATQWHRVTMWTPLSEVAEKYVKKGSKLLVQGKVKYSQWEGQDGVTKYSTEIEARELILLGDPPKSAPTGQASSTPPKSQGFEDFPEALDAEDDDLPF